MGFSKSSKISQWTENLQVSLEIETEINLVRMCNKPELGQNGPDELDINLILASSGKGLTAGASFANKN